MVRRRKNQPQSEEEIVPLRAIREELEMSQTQFAAALGVDASTVSRCERGLYELTLTVLQMKRLCELSGKSLDELPDYLGKESTARSKLMAEYPIKNKKAETNGSAQLN